MTVTAKKEQHKHASEKAVVYAAARRHHIPGWLLWGMYGAENSWTYSNGVPFGLIEGSYSQLNRGKGRTFHNSGLPEAADMAAELVASLKKEHGSLSAAITAYSGGDYTLSRPRELARSHPSQGNVIPVDAPFHLPLPGPLDPGNIWEEAEGLGGAVGGLFGGGGGLTGKAGEIEGGIKGFVAFFVGLGELILTPSGWVRLAKLLGGVYLFLKGLNVIIKASAGVDAAKAAKSTTSKVVEAAATVAAVK